MKDDRVSLKAVMEDASRRVAQFPPCVRILIERNRILEARIPRIEYVRGDSQS